MIELIQKYLTPYSLETKLSVCDIMMASKLTTHV